MKLALAATAAVLLLSAAGCENFTPTPASATALNPATATAILLLPASPVPATAQPSLTASQPIVVITPLPTGTPPAEECADVVCTYPMPATLRRPASAPIAATYPFGSNSGGIREVHAGVEFEIPFGSTVMAAGDGTVRWAGDDEAERFGHYPGEYGNVVILEHAPVGGTQLFSLYAHLSELAVTEGEQVQAGQALGKVGNTGAATGPHLHFEVRFGGTGLDDARNPLLFIESLNPGERGRLVGSIIDAVGRPLPELHLSVQRLPDGADDGQHFETVTYAFGAAPHPDWADNFSFDDLPPGKYRLSVIAGGRLLESFFSITPDQLTYIKLRLEKTEWD